MQWADGVVINLNGRVPDEGAVVEAALAWSRGKPVVAYKADIRQLVASGDNPLVTGLARFQIVSEISHIPNAMATALQNRSKLLSDICDRNEQGERLAELLKEPEEHKFLKLDALLKPSAPGI